MSRLRWCVLSTHVPATGGLGGVVRYTTELVSALGRRSDVDVVAVTTSSAASTMQALVGSTGRVATVRELPPAAMSLYERSLLALDDRYDVVQGVKHLLPRRSPGLRLLTVHDMLLLDRPQDFPWVKRRLLPRPYLRSIHEADLLVNVSAATQRRLLHHAPDAAPRSCVVPLAASSSLLTAAPTPVPSLQGRRFALVVGDASPRKNVATLVDAWPAVRNAVPDAVLVIAGPPSWGRSEVGLAYQRLVAEGAVLPLGRVADSTLRWCYEAAAIVLCPSLAEGFGLPVAEALGLGAEVVVSDDPALVEAAGGRERRVVSARDGTAWAAAVVDAFDAGTGPARRTGVSRTWDDVADDLVIQVRRALHPS